MQIAMTAAGFNAGEADKVRRSMAAWKRKGGLEKFRDQLLQGMQERGYAPQFAQQIYEQILGFGSYGFPMSHSASFALLTYVSCWMKCHEPAAFCAALLNSMPMGFYQPAQLVADARRNGVQFRSPDVASSDWDCTLERNDAGEPEVRIGLRMVNGLPEREGQAIPVARSERRFTSVEDLAQRAGLTKRGLKVLADSGALASLAGHRHGARWAAAAVQKFGGVLRGGEIAESALELPQPHEGQDLIADYRSLGLTLGRHPLALLRRKLWKMRVTPSERLKDMEDESQVRVAGIVTHRQRPGTASGVVFATLEDESGIVNLIIWSKVFDQYRAEVLRSRLMLVSGELQSEQGVLHVVAREIEDQSAMLGELRTESRDFH